MGLALVAVGAWYIVGTHPQAIVATPSSTTPQAAHLSIVVLPFANLSGDASQDYFADGVTESLTTDLSRLSGSFVIARNTAFTFKGKAVDAKAIGRELGVRYLLEGSIQRDASRIRVNVQLINTDSGSHIWAERFDKPVADLLDMQDEIVARLANQLGTQLIAAEARRWQKNPNLDSMDLYFQGMALGYQRVTLEAFEQARSLLSRALALDPGNVDAMVGLGRIDVIEAAGYLVEDRGPHLAAAEADADEGLIVGPEQCVGACLDGRSFELHEPRGRGDRRIRSGGNLDPSLAEAYGEGGGALIFTGRAEEVETQVNQALRLSPRDSNAFIWELSAGGAKIHLGADAGSGHVATTINRRQPERADLAFFPRGCPGQWRHDRRSARASASGASPEPRVHPPPICAAKRQRDLFSADGAHNERHAEGRGSGAMTASRPPRRDHGD